MSEPQAPHLPATVGQAQQLARQLGLERLDAQLLLCDAVQQPHSWLLAHAHDALPAAQARQFLDQAQRRAAGEPLAYILGDKGFFGLTLAVSPDVLIPRPDTETLVEWALEKLPPHHLDTAQATPPKVLDLGTGSGAIALAIQHQRPQALVTAVDASEAALRTAQANAHTLKLPVRFVHGHWLAPLAGERFDLIVSNPPYIAEGDPHLPALRHEPISALTSGPDGLDDLKHIVSHSPAHLLPGGWLLLEHGHDQAQAVTTLLQRAGFHEVSTRFDLGRQARCTGARLPA